MASLDVTLRAITVDVDDDDELEERDDWEADEEREPVHQRHDVDAALQPATYDVTVGDKTITIIHSHRFVC